MYLQLLAAWVLSAMVGWVPVESHAGYEAHDATVQRYEDLATDIAFVAMTEQPLFEGEGAAERTGLLLASLASFESSYNGKIGAGLSVVPGDNDRQEAVGYWQTHPNKAYFPWNRRELAASPRLQARAALAMMRASFLVCRSQPPPFMLAHYAEGGTRCGKTDAGRQKSAHRVNRAMAVWRERPLVLPADEWQDDAD